MGNLKKCKKCEKKLPATKEYFFYQNKDKGVFHSKCKVCEGYEFTPKAKEGYKKCTKCKRELPKTRQYFSFDAKTKDRLCPICKECKGHTFKELPKDGYKICRTCKRELAANTNNFSRHKLGKYGLQSQCKECDGIDRRKRYAANKEYEDQLCRIYSLKNSEKINEMRIKYRENNREKINRYAKERRKTPRGKELMKISKAKRRSILKNLPCDFPSTAWNDCKKSFEYKCAYCGKKTELTQDHFIPLTKGGTHTTNNIVPACCLCNSKKNNTDFSRWYHKQIFYDKERELKILNYINKNNDNGLKILEASL